MVAKPAAAKASAPRAASAAKYDRDLVENYGLVPIFAGTFLLTYAVFPAVIENFLEVVGIGYSAYFAYSYYTSPEARAMSSAAAAKRTDASFTSPTPRTPP